MFRRCFWILFLVCICLGFNVAYGVQDDDEFENLVQNAGFEDGVVTPWTMWVEDAAAVATMSIDKGKGLMDSDALLIDISKKGGGQRVELHQRHFQLEKGQQLTYAFWARTEEDGIVEARMVVNHRADPWTSYGSANITITDEWTEFWTPVNMTADDDIVGIYVELRDTPSLVWFDNFRFYEGEYVETDLEGMVIKAVEPRSKMTSTWAEVKADR